MGYIIDSAKQSDTCISDADGSNRVYFGSPPEWTDKFKYATKSGSLDRTLDGGAVLQVMERSLKGTPITLKGHITAAGAGLLGTKADAGLPVLFSEDDGVTTIECYFDYSQANPLDLEFFDDYKAMMKGTIYLVRA